MPLFIGVIYIYDNNILRMEFKNSKPLLQYANDPLQNFLYALKAPDSKRQYPLRLEYFFDYLGLTGTLKEKCLIFYEQAKKEPLWTPPINAIS
jgi:hypothetical protein